MTRKTYQARRAAMAFARTALVLSLLHLTVAHAGASCDMPDDGDCCAHDADCVAAVNATLCVIVPLNRTAAAEAAAFDPKHSLCAVEQINELQNEAKPLRAICREQACTLALPEKR